MNDDQETTYREFNEVVNLTPKQLDEWLDTDESRSVGQKADGSTESVGHRSGRRIIVLLSTTKSDLSDSDYDHMNKFVGYVHRHLEQRPSGDVTETDWRYSLMNSGHDPTL
ncbi:DUF3140 domain-containing protein [Kribbella sp. NPDC056861]|uniref:DUF3140 domain-containing protein n=1 Tax=Kribbella sp. NPDC056861 TaxID=3154857 RepID=UPI003428EF9D